MKHIKILGGGIAGLTAAINLKRAGLDVAVHECKDYCGKHTRDFQFLENWTFKEDVLDILKNLGIQTDFYVKPWYSQEVLSPSLQRYTGNSNLPLMYLIKRGSAEDTIDSCLAKQAIRQKVDIVKNSSLNFKEANIVATGVKRPTFIASGIKFPFEHPDRSIVMLNDNLSFKMYSYFIVNDNVGEIVSINPAQRKDHLVRLKLTVNRFEKILQTKVVREPEKFSAPVNFNFLNQAQINNQYFIGEAAGFQDCFAGFGMLYAFKSGYLAAKSIIEDIDYDRLWKGEILQSMKISKANRRIYERLANEGYEKIVKLLNSRNPVIRKLLGGEDLRHIMQKVYNNSLSHLLRPLLLW